MKRLLSMLLAALTLLALPMQAEAAPPNVDYYCYTDIVAYVSGAPIRSYNIDGWTGIVAEDLVRYGFQIEYNNDARHLSVIWADTPVTADYTPKDNTKRIGSRAGRVYQTDITVSLECWDGGELPFIKEIQGWNIGGQTIILIDELLSLGNVIWDAQARTISFTHTPSWRFTASEAEDADVSTPIDSFRVIAVNNGTDFTFNGENLDYLSQVTLGGFKAYGLVFGFKLYGRVFESAGALLDRLPDWVSDGKGDYLYDAEAHSPLLDKAKLNEQFAFTVNGEPVTVRRGVGSRGNNHMDYYIFLDCDLPQSEIREFTVTCGGTGTGTVTQA